MLASYLPSEWKSGRENSLPQEADEQVWTVWVEPPLKRGDWKSDFFVEAYLSLEFIPKSQLLGNIKIEAFKGHLIAGL